MRSHVRILFVSSLFPPNVPEHFESPCVEICKELEARRHRVFVLASNRGRNPGDEAESSKAAERLLDLYAPFGAHLPVSRPALRYVTQENYLILRKAIVRHRPDAILLWNLSRITLGPARAAEASGIPTVYALSDMSLCEYAQVPREPGLRGLASHLMDKWLYTDVTLPGIRLGRIVCVSRHLRDALLLRQVPVNDAKIAYPGVHLEQFPLKAAPGAIGDPPRVLYVGPLEADRGVHTLIEALNVAVVQKEGFAPTLSIAGEGSKEYKRKLRSMAAQGTVVVEFMGDMPRRVRPRLFQEHDLAVFPSVAPEPFCQIHLEAMASGTPVISTLRGGIAECLEGGMNVFSIAKENVEQLADRILRALEDPESMTRVAENARRTVEERFSMGQYAARLEAILAEACGSASRRKAKSMAA